jgi:predicted secreted protein
MARRAGKEGTFSIEDSGSTMREISTRVSSVTWNRGAGELDVTALNTNWRDYIPGIRSWSADIRGLYDDGAASALGVDEIFDALMGVYVSETCFAPSGSAAGPKYSGSAILSAYNLDHSVDGPVAFTATLMGVGAYTRT